MHQVERHSASLLTVLPLDQLRESARNIAASELCDEEMRETLEEIPAFVAKLAQTLGSGVYSEEEAWLPDVNAIAALLSADRMRKSCDQLSVEGHTRLPETIRAMRRMLEEYAGASAAAALWSAGEKASAKAGDECSNLSKFTLIAIEQAVERIAP